MAAATLSGRRPPASRRGQRLASTARHIPIRDLSAAAELARSRRIQKKGRPRGIRDERVVAVRRGWQVAQRLALGLLCVGRSEGLERPRLQRSQILRQLVAVQLGVVEVAGVQAGGHGLRRSVDEDADQRRPLAALAQTVHQRSTCRWLNVARAPRVEIEPQ